MTAAEWQTCNDPAELFRCFGLWVDLRRARYLARAVVEPQLHDAFDGDAAHAQELLDRWADRGQEAGPRGRRAGRFAPEDVPEFPRVVAQRLGFSCPPPGRWRPADPRHPDRRATGTVLRVGPPARVCGLIRDIFGNPFRPVACVPEWRTDTAVSLARAMYASRDFSAMPILADALQDAGCDSDDILNHCRSVAGGGSGEPAGGSSAQVTHVRGCWVCDLVLGKE